MGSWHGGAGCGRGRPHSADNLDTKRHHAGQDSTPWAWGIGAKGIISVERFELRSGRRAEGRGRPCKPGGLTGGEEPRLRRFGSRTGLSRQRTLPRKRCSRQRNHRGTAPRRNQGSAASQHCEAYRRPEDGQPRPPSEIAGKGVRIFIALSAPILLESVQHLMKRNQFIGIRWAFGVSPGWRNAGSVGVLPLHSLGTDRMVESP